MCPLNHRFTEESPDPALPELAILLAYFATQSEHF